VSGVPAYMAKAIDAAFPETKARAVKVRRIIQAWLDGTDRSESASVRRRGCRRISTSYPSSKV
jgi:hypothetical protein